MDGKRKLLLVPLLFIAIMLLSSGSKTDFSVDDAVALEPPTTPPRAKHVRPEVQRAEEKDVKLREWNVPYHQWRSRIRAKSTDDHVHTFYTIDCTYHSLWQVLTLEMTWERVDGKGVISRIASGCDHAEKKQPDLAKSVIKGDTFGAYFAPTFSKMPNGEYYAPYNRPNAIWYWLNHTDLTEEVFVLLDPDMAYMKPLPVENVRKGHPVAQFYGYMKGYPLNQFVCPLCPKPGYDQMPYAVGPPWLIHVDDLRTVMGTWVALVPMLREKDKGAWIIEMVAYSVAMAFHGLPHELIYFGMVDNQGQVKVYEGENKNFSVVPSLLHYCYTWEIGEEVAHGGGSEQMTRMITRERTNKHPVVDYYHFSKYRVPTDWPGGRASFSQNFLSCECPLLQEFHTRNLIPGIDTNVKWFRTAVYLEILLPLVNQAVTLWKELKCAPGTANLHKQLRTAHPAFWISQYEILTVTDNKEYTFQRVG